MQVHREVGLQSVHHLPSSSSEELQVITYIVTLRICSIASPSLTPETACRPATCPQNEETATLCTSYGHIKGRDLCLKSALYLYEYICNPCVAPTQLICYLQAITVSKHSSFLGKPIEICIVTRDVQRTMAGLWQFGIGPWKLFTFTPENTSNQTYRGQPAAFTLQVCSVPMLCNCLPS